MTLKIVEYGKIADAKISVDMDGILLDEVTLKKCSGINFMYYKRWW